MSKTNIVIENKTQKNKNKFRTNKKELWNIFENEILQENQQPLECLYRTIGNRETCEQCHFNLAFSDEGFLTCTNNKCGIIYKDLVDFSPEWRYYGADDNSGSDPTRCGMPINPLLPESSFGCKVLCRGSVSYEMRKIGRYTEWQSMKYKEKSQYDEFQIITTMAQNAGIPKLIIDDAIVYHKKISDHEFSFRGDNRDSIIAASIYISCSINNYPRTAKEISTMFHLDSSSVSLGCKNARNIINDLEKSFEMGDKTIFCKTTPDVFIDRYCSKLNINKELTKLCHFVAIKIEKDDLLPENTPHSIAAGIIYFIAQVCHLNITKRDVKLISEISEVTINKCNKKLENLKLIPSKILQKYAKT
jgi:transcription initiation factor TFIIIB Brf1 subunit/transcription initiation factor TFIIB